MMKVARLDMGRASCKTLAGKRVEAREAVARLRELDPVQERRCRCREPQGTKERRSISPRKRQGDGQKAGCSGGSPNAGRTSRAEAGSAAAEFRRSGAGPNGTAKARRSAAASGNALNMEV